MKLRERIGRPSGPHPELSQECFTVQTSQGLNQTPSGQASARLNGELAQGKRRLVSRPRNRGNIKPDRSLCT